MNTGTFTNEQISSRLRDSLDRLHGEILQVEIWAGALSAFARPIPEFELRTDFLLPPRERH